MPLFSLLLCVLVACADDATAPGASLADASSSVADAADAGPVHLCDPGTEADIDGRPCDGRTYCLSVAMQCCSDGSNCHRVFTCSCTLDGVFSCSHADISC